MADLKSICIDGDCSTVPSYLAGSGIGITNGVISNTAPGVTYTAGEGISISDGVITNTDPGIEYTAGTNVQISSSNVISATDTKYTGTSPITVSGTAISHANSGVTAGSKGETANRTLAHNGTFKVLQATVNATGHVTALNERTLTLPKDKYYKLTAVSYFKDNHEIPAGASDTVSLSPQTTPPANAAVVGVRYVNANNASSGGQMSSYIALKGFYVNADKTSATIKVKNDNTTTKAKVKLEIVALMLEVQSAT